MCQPATAGEGGWMAFTNSILLAAVVSHPKSSEKQTVQRNFNGPIANRPMDDSRKDCFASWDWDTLVFTFKGRWKTCTPAAGKIGAIWPRTTTISVVHVLF